MLKILSKKQLEKGKKNSIIKNGFKKTSIL